MCGEFPVERGRVAYFFAEDAERQVYNRIRSSRRAASTSRRSTTDCSTARAGRVSSARRIGKLDMLVLDPLRDIHGGEADKSDSMRNVMLRARTIGTLLGATVVLVHHKSAGDGKG